MEKKLNINFHKFDLIAVILAFVALITYASIALHFSNNYIPASPDENQFLFFSKHLAENNNLIYVNELNKKYTYKIFTPRNYAQEGVKTVPGGFLGHYIIGGLFYSINPKLVFLISPLAAFLSLLVIYKITSIFTSKLYSLLTIVIVSIFPPFFYWSTMIFNNILQLFFFLIMLYFIIRLLEKKQSNISSFLLAVVFALCVVWIRYVDIIFIFLIFVSLIFFHRLFNWKYLISLLVILPLFFIPLLVAGNQFSHNFLSSGPFSKNLFTYNFLITEIAQEVIPFIPFRSLDFFMTNLRVYFVNLLGIFIVFIPLGFFILIKENIEERRRIYIILFSVVILYILYYAGGSFSGFSKTDIILNSSYSRYFLPSYIILTFFISVAFSKFKILRSLFPVIFLIYIYFSLKLIVPSLQAFENQQVSYRKIQSDIVNKTDQLGVIFVKYNDKLIFPKRNIALYLLIKTGDQPRKVATLMEELLHDRVPIYWLNEDWYPLGHKQDFYKKELDKRNIRLVLLDKKNGLYRIEK